MRVVLYQVVNRELVNPKWIDIPDDCRHFDSWLHDNGLGGGSYTIRRGIVQETTPAEAKALRREHDRLKAAGLLPSALEKIIAKVAK